MRIELPRNALYRNNGDGTFTDVAIAAGVADIGYGMGCAVGDYNNDGFADLYVTNFGANVFLRNNGDGTFTDVTRRDGHRRHTLGGKLRLRRLRQRRFFRPLCNKLCEV